jgi:hypothetical protein
LLDTFAEELKMMASPLIFKYQPSKMPDGCDTCSRNGGVVSPQVRSMVAVEVGVAVDVLVVVNRADVEFKNGREVTFA